MFIYRRQTVMNQYSDRTETGGENIMDTIANGVRVRGFPRAGIKHSVAKLPSYHKMSVTTDEFNLVLAYRKHSLEVRKSAYHYLTDKQP